MWLEPLRHKLSEEDLVLRQNWISALASESYRSTHGTAVQEVPIFGAEMSTLKQDSQQSIPSSFPARSSQSNIPSISSSARSSPAPSSSPDEAFQRLQLLAPGLQPGKIGATKQAGVLSHWPTERGIGTSGYISSVAIASDKKFDDARQRLQRIETRRKALVDKYKRPAFMRQGFSKSQKEDENRLAPIRQPAPTQIMSSQQVPNSSQSQGPLGMTMSQPVAGAFGGDRKKPKKPKKKSGFR